MPEKEALLMPECKLRKEKQDDGCPAKNFLEQPRDQGNGDAISVFMGGMPVCGATYARCGLRAPAELLD